MKTETITVIIPCFNEEEALPVYYQAMQPVMKQMENIDFELLVIDDGSTDHTLLEMKALHQKDPRCKYFSFSRNFGKEAAIYAGLSNAGGDYVAVMDVDLQDPPSLLPKMYKILLEEEYDSVATRRSDRAGETKWSLRKLFVYSMEGITGFSVVPLSLASVLGLLTVLALALPAVKRFEIGKSALCRLSFEPLSCIGVAWLGIIGEGTIPMALIASTMDGSLKSELMRAEFLPWSADVMAVVINLAFWMVSYGMFYWGITCYRAIFSLGPWRYFKERTWLGRFLRFIKRWTLNALNVFNETDWERRSTKIIGKAIIANFVILTIISCLWFWGIGALVIYSLVLFFLLQKYWGQMQQKYNTLLKSINEIAEGNLDVEIQEDLGIFNPFKEQLSRIQEGFKKAVAQEVKSERTKSELITNVSHDLKTPLTAIITYVNLLKQENVTEEERKSYVRVLDQKSMRLKVLIEDLFEVSKASSGTVSLHQEDVDIVSLLKQVRFELSDKIAASGIEFRYNLPEEKILLYLDSQKTYRVFENLLVNITKYGMPGTRAYIQVVREDDGHVLITMRNISARELEVSPEELTERFVRGDTSRNTEGSGLGLAIARSFVEVQGGTMKLEVEDDLFRVSIRWKMEETGGAGQEPGRDPEREPVREERETAAVPAEAGEPDMSCMPNMPEIPEMPEMPGSAGAPGKTAADVQKGNVRASAGAEADHDIDISAGTFDMEGVVWGAKEAQEGKKDREE